MKKEFKVLTPDMIPEEIESERQDIKRELESIRVQRIANQRKTAVLVKELNETIERLIEKHPAYKAISKLEKMRDELLSAYENLESIIKLTDGL